MKYLIITATLMLSAMSLAQVDSSATRAMNPPILPTKNLEQEVKQQSRNSVRAERRAKEKAQSQRQTKAQPHGLPPNLTDTLQIERKNPPSLAR